MDICRNNGNFDHSHDENQADHAQETKDIVVATLVLPQAPEDEQQLDEDDRERHQTRQEYCINTSEVPRLLRDLPSDAVGFGRMFPWLTTMVPDPAANVYKRDLNQKPKRDECDEGTEWQSGTGCLGPDKEIENENRCEEQAREEKCRLQRFSIL